MPFQRVARTSFVARPFGRVTFGPSWLVWAASPTEVGSAAWGMPSADELRQAFELWDALWSRAAAPLTVVTDITTLRGVPTETFAALSRYVAPRLGAMAALATRHLVWVAPELGDPVRALGVGFLGSLGALHTWHVTDDAAQAAHWLKYPGATERLAEIGALRDEGAGVTPLLRDLRAAIGERLADPAIDVAARALGMSERTLQRRLAELGTAFRDEVNAVRCRVAAHLLVEGDKKIAAIAREVGLGSASHFALAFKQHFGASPSEYRERRRAR